MAKEDRVIAKQRLLVCSNCQRPSRTQVMITSDMLPVKLTCPHCNVQITMETIPELPKVEAPQKDSWWSVQKIEEIGGDEEEPDLSEPEKKQITFMSRAMEISDSLMVGLEKIYHLQRDIAAFEQSFFEHFTESSRLADFFLHGWNPHYLRDFIEHPFVVIPIHCDDELARQYARLILAPKFIQPKVGIPLPGKGGVRLELVNQYSLISKPIISAAFREYLHLPALLDLRLVGKKIIGSSLDHCWRDIPGILLDAGHTDEAPSIIIHPKGSLPARTWLAQHGTAGWMPREIPARYARKEEMDAFVKADDQTYQAFLKLGATSRLGVFWQDIMRAREFAVKASNCIKGSKLIVLSRLEDRDAWEALGIGNHSRLGDNVAFHFPSDTFKVGHGHIGIERIADIRMIIVDHLYAVNLSMLRTLFDYEGILLVLSDDAYLDFSSENLRASLLHGLVCESVYDEEDKYIQPDAAGWVKAIHWEHPIRDALANIRRQEDRSAPTEPEEELGQP